MEESDQGEYSNGRIDELVQRIEEIESEEEEKSGNGAGCVFLGYAMGMTMAMILSWSRNASILWCMLHGLFSWHT